MMTELVHELIMQYRLARYRIGMDSDAFDLSIDVYSAPMFELMAEKNASSAAIITAYNPFSQIQSDQTNLSAHDRLQEALQYYSVLTIDSINMDSRKIWPDEKSICILDLDLEAVCSIGKQFGQNAIVWIAHDAVPRLVLLR